jgi:hypothetical protein
MHTWIERKPSRVLESCILKGKGKRPGGGEGLGFMALGFWGFGKVICKLTNAEVKGNKMVQFSLLCNSY